MLYFQSLLKILHATNEISNSSKFELQQEKIEAYEAAQRINKIVFDELEREGFPVIHKKGFRYIETDDEYYQAAENIVPQDTKNTSEKEEILDETFEKTSDNWDVTNYEFGENPKRIKDKEDKKDVEHIERVDAVVKEAVKNESDNNEDDEDCQEFDFDMYMNHHSETLSSKQNKVSESVSESNNSNFDNTSIDEFNFDSYLNHQVPDSVSISETEETKEDTENMTVSDFQNKIKEVPDSVSISETEETENMIVSDSQNKTEEVHVEKESEIHLENSDNIGQNETTLLQDKIEESEPEIDNQETKESDMISKTDIESEEPEKTNVPESTGILDEQIEHVESEEQLSRPDTNEKADIKSEENKEDEEAEVETETETDNEEDDDNNISSMLKYDFTLIYYQLYIRNKEHKTVARIELVTSPLYLTEDSRNILVWCQYDRENVVKSSGQKKHEVVIPVGDFGLIVNGIYKDGKFDSHIKLRKLDTDNGFYLYEKRKVEFGTKGHIIISDEDVVIHVVPSSFKNNKTGNADFFYCIEVGDEREVGYARGVDHIPFSIDETPYDLVCRWNDDVLHSMVTSPGTMNLN